MNQRDKLPCILLREAPKSKYFFVGASLQSEQASGILDWLTHFHVLVDSQVISKQVNSKRLKVPLSWNAQSLNRVN